MALADHITDEYVASLLSKEAHDASLKYSALGMEAYRNTRPAKNLKPNTRFLRQVLTNTKTHNQALLAKEAAESQARLDELAGTSRMVEAEGALNHNASKGSVTYQGRSQHNTRGRRHSHLRCEHETRQVDQTRHRSDAATECSSCRQRRASGVSVAKTRSHRSSSPSRRERRHGEQAGHRDTLACDRLCSPLRCEKKFHRDTSGRHRSSSTEREKRSHHQESPSRNIPPPPTRHVLKHLQTVPLSSNGDERQGHPQPDHRIGCFGKLLSPRQAESDRQKQPISHTDGQSYSTRRESIGNPWDSDSDSDLIGPQPASQSSARLRGQGLLAKTSKLNASSEQPDDWGEALGAVREQRKWKQQAAGQTCAPLNPLNPALEPELRWAKPGESREWDKGKMTLE